MVALRDFRNDVAHRIVESQLETQHLERHVQQVVVDSRLDAVGFHQIAFGELTATELAHIAVLVLIFDKRHRVGQGTYAESRFRHLDAAPIRHFSMDGNDGVCSNRCRILPYGPV